MSFNGLTNEDFDVFTLNGLEERMEQIKQTIRPKLEFLGDTFAPALSSLTGIEMFHHVARHARRTINPPNDTWVAFASSKRGYKMLPHFQIGLWETHLFVWFAVIYEAPSKEEFGKKLENNISKILDSIPNHYMWSGDHMKPDAIRMSEMTHDDLLSLFRRLQTVKKAEILCGIQIPREQAVRLDGSELVDTINSAFVNLVPLYKLS
ncbi:YktB family protein [Heyndrickxia acidicola]|uniref:UPF0637 protein P4T90_14360 n=1 Tax=Heyndrickxia acidicola TaxID=209389 RepID=A0ABU6MLX3_9BACI|nr:DUF1054 domain-containing protein [Heyndrickxia acidicola]MED1204227.1 DUF1054 domain-containing protein [Heyndrickxia acidicola]